MSQKTDNLAVKLSASFAACKRKAEDFPPLMGSSPLMSWSSYVKCMVISSRDNRKVAAKSTFKINRELIRILGVEPHGVTKQRSGDLMVELRNKEHERNLEDVSSFLDNLLKKLPPQSPGGHSIDPFACGHFWNRKSRRTCKISLDIELGRTFTCLLVGPRI